MALRLFGDPSRLHTASVPMTVGIGSTRPPQPWMQEEVQLYEMPLFSLVTLSLQASKLAGLPSFIENVALKELGVFFFEKKNCIQTFETSAKGPLLGQVKYRVSVISHTLIISPNEQLFTTAWLTRIPRTICSVSLSYECGPPKRWAAIKKGSCHSEVAIVNQFGRILTHHHYGIVFFMFFRLLH